MPTVTKTGFLGDSERKGYRRLYLTRGLDSYAEFRVEDVVHTSSVPAGEPPYVGDEATRVVLRGDANVEFARTRPASKFDEFDLDVRLPRRRLANVVVAHTNCDAAECLAANDTFGGLTCEGTCPGEGNTCDGTCPADETCFGLTCEGTCEGNTCMGTCEGDHTCPQEVCLAPPKLSDQC